jgi:MFS family permease
MFMITASFGFLQPFVPLYLEASGLSREQIGWIVGTASAIALLVQPVLGRWSDRVDRRRPFIAGTAVAALAAYWGYRYADGFWAMTLLTAIGANGTLYLNSAGGVLVGRMVSAAKGGAGYASYRVWGSVGYVVSSVTTGIGLHLVFGGTGGYERAQLNPVFFWGPLVFAAIAVLSIWIPDAPKPAPTADGGPLPDLRRLRPFLAAYFLYLLSLYGASQFLGIFVKDLGADPIWVPLMFAGGVVVEVLVMLRAGILSDRFGRKPLLIVSFAVLPVRMLLYAWAATPSAVAAIQLLHGINFGIVGIVAVVLANDLAHDGNRGAAQARLAAAAGISSALGPVMFGRIVQHAGFDACFLTSAGIAVVALAILIWLVRETHEAPESILDHAPSRVREALRKS